MLIASVLAKGWQSSLREGPAIRVEVSPQTTRVWEVCECKHTMFWEAMCLMFFVMFVFYFSFMIAVQVAVSCTPNPNNPDIMR